MEEITKNNRIRVNISTNAKGQAQFDVTVELVDADDSLLRPKLEEAISTAKEVAKSAGFGIAGIVE
jgi:LDH2 family malate/lactate/ureidoglycolate dehydrogenase